MANKTLPAVQHHQGATQTAWAATPSLAAVARGKHGGGATCISRYVQIVAVRHGHNFVFRAVNDKRRRLHSLNLGQAARTTRTKTPGAKSHTKRRCQFKGTLCFGLFCCDKRPRLAIGTGNKGPARVLIGTSVDNTTLERPAGAVMPYYHGSCV